MKQPAAFDIGVLAVLVCIAPLALHAQSADGIDERVTLFTSEHLNAGAAALSPDDSRLALEIRSSPAEAALWLFQDGIAEPERLTSDGHWDGMPEWSPQGDRLYFTSNRPPTAGDRYMYGMVVDIDPGTGRAINEPRQITPDPVAGVIRVSPDGQAVAYIDANDRQLLRVVPADGGPARVVARLPVRSGNIAWSRDGQHIHFVSAGTDVGQRLLKRVSLGGGDIEVVGSEQRLGRIIWGPGAETYALEANLGHPLERSLTLIDRQGAVLGTLQINRNARVAHLTADGHGVVAVEANVVAPTRIMPIAGGPYREVTSRDSYDWVMRWSDDGSAVYTWTMRDEEPVLARVGLAGGEPKFFPETPEWGNYGGNSGYLFQVSRRDGSNPRKVIAVTHADGSRHTISEALPGSNFVFAAGPGGTTAAHDELYYFERDGDRVDLKAWSGPDTVRKLRSLPAVLVARSAVAVHGERVVWQEEVDDGIAVMIADGPYAEPRRLLTMGMLPGRNEFAFSHDGSRIALHYSRGPGSPDLMAIVDVSDAAEPRIIDTELAYWYWPRWLPDDSGVLVIGGGSGLESHVALVPADGTSPTVNVTEAHDPSAKWGFEVSPDGRYIAYPGEIWAGSSVWRQDLGQHAR